MNLFEVIPENLFSVLASKNKEIYLDALFVIHRAYKQEMFIKKDELVTMLIADLEDKMMEADWENEEDLQEKNLSGMAHFLMRRLVDTGWIDIVQAYAFCNDGSSLYHDIENTAKKKTVTLTMPMAKRLIAAALTGDQWAYQKVINEILYYLKRNMTAYLSQRKKAMRRFAESLTFAVVLDTPEKVTI